MDPYVENLCSYPFPPLRTPTCCSGQLGSLEARARRIQEILDSGIFVPVEGVTESGGSTACLGFGESNCANIQIPDFGDPKCVSHCGKVHERKHAERCVTLGPGYFDWSMAQGNREEVEAYEAELTCIFNMISLCECSQ